MPTLTILRGDAVVNQHDLAERDLRIGRGKDNDIVLEDPGKAVSRFHAELRREGGAYVLLDLNSQNGVWIDGRRIQRETVAPGMAATVGPYRLVFSGEWSANPADGGTATLPRADATLPKAEATPTSETQRTPRVEATPAPRKKSARTPQPAGSAPPAPGLIGFLLRLPRPVLFGGFVGVCLLIIIAGQVFNAEDAPPPQSAAAVPVAAPAEKQPTNAEQIAVHLTAGKEALAAGRPEEARELFDKALLIDREHSEAVELKAQADDAIRKSRRPPTPILKPPTRQSEQPPAPAPVATSEPIARETFLVTPRPGETRAATRLRDKAARSQLTVAEDAAARGDLATAERTLNALLQEEPQFPGASELLARIREEQADAQRAAAQKDLTEGARLEASGDLVGAMAAYQRVQKSDPESATARIAQLRDRMRTAGEDAFRRARQYDALGRVPEALALFERAAQLLPENHPNRSVAQERVAALKAIIR